LQNLSAFGSYARNAPAIFLSAIFLLDMKNNMQLNQPASHLVTLTDSHAMQ